MKRFPCVKTRRPWRAFAGGAAFAGALPLGALCLGALCLGALFAAGAWADEPRAEAGDKNVARAKSIRVGVIGLDTSHAIAFTKLLNQQTPPAALAGCRVVAAYPRGSADIESSVSRVPKYTEEIRSLGVEIVDSIPALLEKVDAVLLETNDGRPHFEQALQVLRAKKPVFIDKPLAGSLADCAAIFMAAQTLEVPVFSSSSLRWAEGAQDVRHGAIGQVLGADAYSPASLEKTHPDLFWYGIHGVELLYTMMGPGCQTVTRATSADCDVVVGKWSDGRLGVFRGIRKGSSGYGGVAYGEKQIRAVGPYRGYQPLVEAIVKFFGDGQPPVSAAETLELYAFMEAADESKRQGGAPVSLAETLTRARGAAAAKLKMAGVEK